MNNDIRIERVPGDGTDCTVTIQLSVDLGDAVAVARLEYILCALVPENDRAQFVADFGAAAARAGFQSEGA